jgi:hypothetical protein
MKDQKKKAFEIGRLAVHSGLIVEEKRKQF